jgi:hypothetical protein
VVSSVIQAGLASPASARRSRCGGRAGFGCIVASSFLSQPVYVGPGELLVDAVVLHLAIYNSPDDCRDGIDSAEALIQGTIHRSTSSAGAAKSGCVPASHIPRPHRTPSNRVIRQHLHPPATAGRRGQVANSTSMVVLCMANSSLHCGPGTMWLSGPNSYARMIMAIALAKSAITSRRTE